MRRIAVVSILIAAFVAIPAAARADGGGAFISLDETYYVVGDSVVANAYATIPKSRWPMVSQGPFYAYVLDSASWIRSAQPLPGSAIRVATFTPNHQGQYFQFLARFTMPTLTPGWYHVAFCNDPCTIDGFREPLRGQFAVVATAREGQLLAENGRLHGQLSWARRQLSRAQKRFKSSEQDVERLRDQTSAANDLVLTLRHDVWAAQQDAAAVRETSRTERRAALILGAEVLIGTCILVIVRRSRRRRPPKPGARLGEEAPGARRAVALTSR